MLPAATPSGGGQTEQERPWDGGVPLLPQSYSFKSHSLVVLFFLALFFLVLFFANFFTGSFTSQRGLHAFLLARFQVKGVALNLFDDVFLLHFALETAQSVFEGFTLLQSNFRQTDTPPNPSRRTE